MAIDLRSDTLTLPTEHMRKAMYEAEVGDQGRAGSDGRGEDPTVNRLERLAAELTGKEDAAFVPSGTMGNLIALLTHCSKSDKVAVERNLHIYRAEGGGFKDKIGGLQAVFFETERFGTPKLPSVTAALSQHHPRLLCLENTHNFAGGTCFGVADLERLAVEAGNRDALIHLDGARIFNASVATGVPVPQLVSPVASLMFCLSKGLGAPVGSLLCGLQDFIREARQTQKLLGGVMRQAGVIAAAGIVALTDGVRRLGEDHQNARMLASRLAGQKNIELDLDSVQTNIVMVDVSSSGRDAQTFKAELEQRGLKVHAMSAKHIRMVTFRGVGKRDVLAAADIFNRYCERL